MAELESACCSPAAQQTCCEPDAKAACCGSEGGTCGCAAAESEPDVREAVREPYASHRVHERAGEIVRASKPLLGEDPLTAPS
jgi:hypothetical protein